MGDFIHRPTQPDAQPSTSLFCLLILESSPGTLPAARRGDLPQQHKLGAVHGQPRLHLENLGSHGAGGDVCRWLDGCWGVGAVPGGGTSSGGVGLALLPLAMNRVTV